MNEHATRNPRSDRVRAHVPLLCIRLIRFALRINGGQARTSTPDLRLDLTTTGAQPSQIMIGERPGPGFRGARWQSYRPTTGAGGGQQRYLLQDRTSGRKTIHVKVRSGTTDATESESVFASIEFVNVVTHQADPLEVLQFAQRNGFEHSAAVLRPLATQGAPAPRCSLSDGGGFNVIGPEGTVCLFRIMGRALNAGWTVADVRPLVDASRFRLRIQQSASGRSAQMQFTIENITPAPFRVPFTPVPPPEISSQPGIRVHLRGPDEQDWRDAFRR